MEPEQEDPARLTLPMLEAIASNCSLRFEHVQALNTSDLDLLMRLYNMCEHTWDPNKTWDVYYWEELLPPLVVYSLTLLLGIIGNLLIIVAIVGYRKMKTPTNIFLASLAFADLLLCIVCLPVKLAELFSFTWTFGLFLCKFVNYIQNVSAIASVLNLTVMSLERCYAIVYPMKAKSVCTVSKANKVVGLVWVMAFTLATPTIYIQIHLPVGLVPGLGHWCVRHDGSPASAFAWRAHELYLLALLLAVPGGLMTAAYGAIAREICRCMKERAYFVAGGGEESRDKNKINSCDFAETVELRARKPHSEDRAQAGLSSCISPSRPKGGGGDGQGGIGGIGGIGGRRIVLDFDSQPVLNDETAFTSVAGMSSFARRSTKGSSSCESMGVAVLKHNESFSSLRNKQISRNVENVLAEEGVKHAEIMERKLKTRQQLQGMSCDDRTAFLNEGPDTWIPITSGYKVQKQSLNKFRRVIRMLVVIVVVFVVCWTPYLVMNVLQSFGVIDSQLRGTAKYLKTGFTLMAYLNSALNPIIYGFMCRSFRESFLKSVCSSCLQAKRKRILIQQQMQDTIMQSQNNPQVEQQEQQGNGLRANRSRGPGRLGYRGSGVHSSSSCSQRQLTENPAQQQQHI